MNNTARFPSRARPVSNASFATELEVAIRDTAAFIFIREAYKYFAPPAAHREQVSARARRFMRSGG